MLKKKFRVQYYSYKLKLIHNMGVHIYHCGVDVIMLENGLIIIPPGCETQCDRVAGICRTVAPNRVEKKSLG